MVLFWDDLVARESDAVFSGKDKARERVNTLCLSRVGNRAVLTAVRFSVGCKKTTVFTVVLVLPCISEPAERSGIEQKDSNELSDQKTEPVQ